jgi:tRNA G10  N-methylase Trm11
MVRAWAAPGWALFDPFCGAGTVLVAGRRAGLHVGGADADTGNVALARQALENEAGRDEAADQDQVAAGALPHS